MRINGRKYQHARRRTLNVTLDSWQLTSPHMVNFLYSPCHQNPFMMRGNMRKGRADQGSCRRYLPDAGTVLTRRIDPLDHLPMGATEPVRVQTNGGDLGCVSGSSTTRPGVVVINRPGRFFLGSAGSDGSIGLIRRWVHYASARILPGTGTRGTTAVLDGSPAGAAGKISQSGTGFRQYRR